MAENLQIAKVFFKQTLLTDDECNAIKTSRTVPTTDWLQLNTKGSVEITVGEESVEVGNDQFGATGYYEIKKPVTIKIPLSIDSFDNLAKYAILDPNWSSGATGMDVGDKIGTKLTGFSILIYARANDPDNNTNTPDVTCDAKTWVIYEAIRNGDVMDRYSPEQGIIELNLIAVANDGSGSARGYKAYCGTLTAA